MKPIEPISILLIRHHPAPADQEGRYARTPYPLIPLGLAYVAAALGNAGFDVKVLDTMALCRTKGHVRELIRSSGAGLIGITATTDSLPGAFEAGRIAKSSLPDVPLVLGGPHMATYPEETLLRGPFDFGVVGEGESTILDLAGALSSGRDPTGTPGLLVKKAGSLSAFTRRERLRDLDQLPHPARGLFPNALYRTALGRNPVSYILTSRGCPFNCAFCDHGIWGKRVTFHSPEWVVEEMARCLSFGAKEIYIYDETFTLDGKRVSAICNLIGRRGMRFPWVISSRVDTIDREMIRELRKAGCRQIRFGVESGAQHHLKALNKGISLEQVRRTFEICKETGMETFAYFMLGLPDETREEMEETIRFALELNPDWVNFNILTVKPGTELFKRMVEAGEAPRDFWMGYLKGTAKERDCYFVRPGLSPEDLNGMVHRAHRRFYFRPAFFKRRLRDAGHPTRWKAYLQGCGTYINRFAGQFANVRTHSPLPPCPDEAVGKERPCQESC